MEYNRLKLTILKLFGTEKEYDSRKVQAILSDDGVRLSTKAVEMALMRYWRQGLLKRSRRGRRFQYAMTDRGFARREWLSQTMTET